MADDRPRGRAAAGSAEDIHDDDELAAALAAELDRLAQTGAVPVLRMPFAPAPAPEATTAIPPVREAVRARVEEPSRPAASPARAAAASHRGPRPAEERPEALAPRSARGSSVATDPDGHHRHLDTSSRPAERRDPAVPPEGAGAIGAGPRSARTPSFSITGEVRPDGGVAPGRRRAAPPDAPHATRLPDAARPVPRGPMLPEPPALEDPLRETGPLALPPTLYEAWERSLRSIGRPRTADEASAEVEQAEHAEPDAPTAVLSRAALGPLPPPPAPPEPAPVPDAVAPPEGAPDPEPAALPRRRRERRPEAVEAPVPPIEVAPVPVVEQAPDDDEGVDEVPIGIRSVSAADTAAVPLPPMIEATAPVTGAVPLAESVGERSLPLGGPSLLSVLLLWAGALASPLLLLAGTALAVAGAAGGAAAVLVLAVAVLLPASVRLTSAADADHVGSPAIAARLYGPRGGPVVAAVLLAARLLAAVLALVGVADLAAGFVARTGVGGTSTAAAAVSSVVGVGLAAVVAVVWSRRVTRISLGALAALALLGTAAVLILTAPAVAVVVPTPPVAAATPLAGALGFGAVGLVLAATAPDAVRTASGRSRGRGAGPGLALAALVGVVVLVVAVAVGRGDGASGDPAVALAGVLADATPAAAAAPLAALLLVAALPLPALLVSTAGDAAAVLLGAGRSARLGAVAAGLLALAVALVLLAVGVDAATALASLGPVLGVPVAAWAGVVTLSPLRAPAGRSARAALGWATAVAVVVGWLLTDGLAVPGERSPLLDVLHVGAGSAWRGTPAAGLLAAFLLGLAAAVLARVATVRSSTPPASRLRSGSRQPVDSVEA